MFDDGRGWADAAPKDGASRRGRFGVRLPIRLVLLFACGMAVGCGPSGPKLHAVRGTVTVNKKPAVHAIVFLHRKGRSDMNEPVPFGRVGDDGGFKITTRTDGDGAQEGEYAIAVFWPDMSKPADGNGQRPDALFGAYDKVAESKIAFAVKPGENTIPPLELTPGTPPRKPPVRDPNDK